MAFVGRVRPMSRVLATAEDAARGRARLVLIGGPAGIGKTTLVGEAVLRTGMPVGWGTCVDADRTPALWPWTAALRGLAAAIGAPALTAADAAELARVLPELAPAGEERAGPDPDPDSDAARLRLFDTIARYLEGLARRAPAVLVLDDLQWADPSSLELLRFLARPYRPVPLVVVAVYRDDELDKGAAGVLGELAAQGEPIVLRGLARDEVFQLVAATVDAGAAQRWADEVHRRSGGHPFLARQLAELLADPTRSPGEVPAAVREVVARRTARLSAEAAALLEAAAVAGNELLPDVLAEVCGVDAATVTDLSEEAVAAGVLVREGDPPRTLIAHDLFRESIVAGIAAVRLIALHQRIADALEHRHDRGAAVLAADLARHSAAAVPLDGGDRAVRWARAAAAADRRRLAFGEAAAHFARARRALEDTGAADAAPVLVDLLVEEADAQARAGDTTCARTLLDDARHRAAALGDSPRLGRVALGVQRLGARFAMPRDAVVDVLEEALGALRGTGTALEAQLTAGLARELHHSVPEQRSRARPLSEQAIALARRLDDPETLNVCLLARHDVLWTPGRAAERVGIAREITALADRTGDVERRADGLLLTANALLEDGSAAFRSALAHYLHAAEQLRQPRHDYLVATRRAALALIDARLDEAERLITEATVLGERIAEPDVGNVRMSQLLGLVRARGEPERLRATAAEAVRWWVGVPSHSHAVAACLLVLTGDDADLDAARRALDTVVALDTWRADRSYLWSVFVGAMATAAIGLRDRGVCAQLLAELEPVADSCGVNGALVCFMGSNAHWAGMLAAALGRRADAERRLGQALAVHQRLGAPAWEAETRLELAALTGSAEHAARAAALAAGHGLHGVSARLGPDAGHRTRLADAEAELRRDGELWRVRHRDTTVHLPDVKGLADLAVLLARPGTDVHVLELAGAAVAEPGGGDLLDATARAAYRHRLHEIDQELETARDHHDLARVQQLELQRSALLAELRRAAGLAGRHRTLGGSTAERARKAVSARVRDAIRRIGLVHPELGAHLDRSVRTGTHCCYEPAEPVTWALSPAISAPSPRA